VRLGGAAGAPGSVSAMRRWVVRHSTPARRGRRGPLAGRGRRPGV
jgi:hypothetical protein